MTSKSLTALFLGLWISSQAVGATPCVAQFYSDSVGLSTPAQSQEIAAPLPKPPKTVVPALENPVTGLMEAGRLIITVSATRKYADGPSVNYGFRTGEAIPVTVVISADPGVLVDIESLKDKTISKGESEFEIIAKPVVVQLERNGKNITVLQIVVRTWNMDPSLILNFQFHYATNYLPDKKTPAWKVGTTPDFVISTSRTATPSSKQLLDGDMGKKATYVRAAEPLKIGGILVMLLVPLFLAWRLWNIWRLAEKLTKAQRAWKVIDEVVRNRGTTGGDFSVVQLEQISAGLREYLEVASVSTAQLQVPLGERFAGHERKADMLAYCFGAFAKLDRAIYGKAELTHEECDALLDEIARIIPRE